MSIFCQLILTLVFVLLLPMKHRGEIIEKAIRSSGVSITEIAKRLHKSRQWVYNLFDNPSVSTDIVNTIGKIILHDFSKEIEPLNSGILTEEHEEYHREGSAGYWKEKYYALLEEHLEVLKKLSK